MHPDVRLVGGRYELTALIATGGMGQVWQARDPLLGRDVAVKVLRSEYTGDPTFLTRFRGEAQLAAGLVHPHIATLFDYGEVPPARPTDEHLAYLVMELVRGESLSGLLHRTVTLSPERTLDVLRQCADGLAAAHAAGVVHRDVKPGNVLIGTDGTVKITDFGVAVSGSSVPLTGTGQVMGTPHYLSPEQAGGARATPASDVYALGVIGYLCLTGRRVFEAESPLQVALLQLHGTPDPLPDDVPAPVRRLVETALVKDPASRFPDGAAFRDAIDDVLAGRPLHLPAPTAAIPLPPEPAVDPDRPPRRRRLLASALTVAAAAAVAGGLLLAGGGGDGEAAAGTTAPSSTPPPSTAAPSPQLVRLATADHVGRPVAEVQAELTARGLLVTLRPLQTADVPDGEVIALDPAGDLAPGSPVTVTHAVAPPAPAPAPVPDTATTTVTDPGTGQADQPATPADPDTGNQGNGNGNGNGNAGGNGKGNGRGNG
ncbi:serine/threonine-protein kinase [Modestobacter versicolor]|uniref:serine/threonine-protein kinase n=1 Tax=Modestobacter versicolor TaxID=429133 RepID=UPI0034DEA5C2